MNDRKQKKTIRSQAAGKIMIMGDHGAVYGYSCLAAAINKYVVVKVKTLKEKMMVLESKSDIVKTYRKSYSELKTRKQDKNTAFVEAVLLYFLNKFGLEKGLRITADSKALSGYGLGSSSAVTVSLLQALLQMKGISLSRREFFELARDVVFQVQNTGSGYDVASAIYGGIIYYKDKGQVIEKLQRSNIPLMLIYTGKKADTVSMINLVRKKMNSHRKAVLKIFETISEFTYQAKEAITKSDWLTLGKYMNFSQDYLEDLGVSTDKINSIVESVRNEGALGAKLSGAGGGDCVIVLFDRLAKKRIQKAAEKAGGEVLDTKICWHAAV